MQNRLNAAARQMQNANLGVVSAARVKQARELVSQEAADHPARLMADVVNSWLERASNDYGVANAIGIILSMIEQSGVFAFDDEPEN